MLTAMAQPGNASSVHGPGREARRRIEHAREQVAQLAGARSRDVVFTGSGTEANNQILANFKDRRLFVSAIEHDSTLNAAAQGATLLPVGSDGLLDVAASLTMIASCDQPCLVAVMAVNNETGLIQPILELSQGIKALDRDHDRNPVHLHCDAVQGAGKMWLDMVAMGVDSFSLSAHKLGGPQGVGALIHAPGLELAPLVRGGGQERRMRAGTENVAGIVGFGAAALASLDELADSAKMRAQRARRQRLVDAISQLCPTAVFFSEHAERQLGTTINVALPGKRAETSVMKFDLAGIAISAGSACSSGKVNQSAVIMAMSGDDVLAQASIRLSMGWATTDAQIDEVIERLPKLLG